MSLIRAALAVITGGLVAATVFLTVGLLLYLMGGSECDRADCNWFGELSVSTPLPFFIVLLLALGLGFIAGRAMWRTERRT